MKLVRVRSSSGSQGPRRRALIQETPHAFESSYRDINSDSSWNFAGRKQQAFAYRPLATNRMLERFECKQASERYERRLSFFVRPRNTDLFGRLMF